MSLESQIKRQILARSQSAVLQYARGWQSVCQEEIQSILSRPLTSQKLTPKLSHTDDGFLVENISYRQLLELPLRLCTVRDVLWILKQNRAGSMLEVKNSCRKIPWHLILPSNVSVTLRVQLSKSRLRHEGALEECVAKELTTLGFRITKRVNSNKEGYFLIDVKLRENQLIISLSMVGAPLYKRGYKKHLGGQATMREDLAACLTRMALGTPIQRDKTPRALPELIYVPFAGSGTLGFEALLYFLQIGPAIFGRDYAFSHFLCTPENTLLFLLKTLRSEHRELISLVFQEKVAKQSELLQQNATSFESTLGGSTFRIRVEQGDFFDGCELQKDSKSIFLPLNPPWGIRQGEKTHSTSLYRKIGEQIKSLSLRYSELFGFLVAPDKGSAQAFVQACSGFETESIPTKSGGQPIVVTYFSFSTTHQRAENRR